MDSVKRLGPIGSSKGPTLSDATSVASLNGKLDIAITKIENADRTQELIFDKLEKLVESQSQLVSAQEKLAGDQEAITKAQKELVESNKVILSTLTNGMLELKQALRQTEPLTKATRVSMAFTGGLAGGLAGGAVMVVILRLLMTMHHPITVSAVSLLQLRGFFQRGEKLVKAIGYQPMAFCFNQSIEERRGKSDLLSRRTRESLYPRNADEAVYLPHLEGGIAWYRVVSGKVTHAGWATVKDSRKVGPTFEGFHPCF